MQHTRTPVAQVYIHAVVNRDFAVSVNYTHNSVVRLLIGTCPGFNKPLSGVVGTTVGGFFLFGLGYNPLFLLLFGYRYAYSNRNTKKLAV
jgi:hypothetical protein